ncbi:AMP-binding protein, partial [Haematobacter missouriensis]|uniref:AMP-binding protein n=2 Tax=Haematobacter missouriensis TaxID=366616 RepID=UPI00054FC3DD
MEQEDKALDREQAVLRNLLDRYAEDRPEALFVHFWPDVQWSYRVTWEKVRQRAATLHAHGVRRGSHVLCFMGNGPDLLVTWFAINYLCAVYIPLNTASRGKPLEHILTDIPQVACRL